MKLDKQAEFMAMVNKVGPLPTSALAAGFGWNTLEKAEEIPAHTCPLNGVWNFSVHKDDPHCDGCGLCKSELEQDGVEKYTFTEFMDACKNGWINDYDGSGYYGSETSEVRVSVSCIDGAHGRLDDKYTHVWWYAK